MAGPMIGVFSKGRTAAGRVFRKQNTATIQNTVVGQPGTKMPMVPAPRPATPTMSRIQRAAG